LYLIYETDSDMSFAEQCRRNVGIFMRNVGYFKKIARGNK